MRKKAKRKIGQRLLALAMVLVILVSSELLPLSMKIEARTDHLGNTDTYWSSTWHYYCIDHSGIAANGHGGNGDLYQGFAPSAGLSSTETAILFWAALSMQASFGNMPTINKCYQQINEKAEANGLKRLSPAVTQNDLGTLLHLSSTRKKYAWLDDAVARADQYLALAGLMSGAAVGEGSISGAGPAVLAGHTSREQAYEINRETLTIPFDPEGKDREFLRSVSLKFWNGSEYSTAVPEGWSYEKTDTEIRFYASDPSASLQVQFDTEGTQYGFGAGGSYQSPEEVYEDTLELWLCMECAGTHKNVAGGTVPLDGHQRCIFLDIPENVDQVQASYYASTDGKGKENEGSLEFKIYRHEEDWKTNYRIRLYKYDYETGKALEGAIFQLYERFDDRDQIQDKDGYGVIYRGGETPYLSYHKDDTVTWDGYRFVSSLNTDWDGLVSQDVNHGYHYEKTFCDGHPEPKLAEVPEEEQDENGEVTNQDEIDDAEDVNADLQEQWQACVDACENYAGQYPGVHFHWLNDGAEESASGDESFVRSGCREDAEITYQNFIALRYSYAIQEKEARTGYTLHGKHRDDIPIEIIRTDSSENGANAEFTGEYSGEITASIPSRINKNADAKVVKMERQYFPAKEAQSFHYQERILEYPAKILKIWHASAANAEKATPSNAQKPKVYGEEKATPGNAQKIPMQSGERATPGNAQKIPMQSGERATPGNAQKATPDSADRQIPKQVLMCDEEDSDEEIAEDDLFERAYEDALADESVGAGLIQGPSDRYSHTFQVYDHRTEGEIHLNKRDMQLEQGETEQNSGYHSYGDSQGDAVLEGAVYGLFARAEIVHPDGKTGTVYQKGNLVAVAATDKNGDASFLVNTVAPGQVYDYTAGKIVKTEDGFAARAPANLYTKDQKIDDYTEDEGTERIYTDNETVNGNCWIGRPLFLGEYYIKELTRSEGYELSVSNRNHEETNAGQNLNEMAEQEEGDGYALITKNLYYEVRPSDTAAGTYDDPDYNELFFFADSQKTGKEGFEILLGNLPPGTKAYRAESGTRTVEMEVPYGDYQERPVFDQEGNPVYVVVQEGQEGKYPKYHSDGTFVTREKTVNATVRNVKKAAGEALDHERCEEVMRSALGSMGEDEVEEQLEKTFTAASELFLKAKLEEILRANGRRTPIFSGRYSALEEGVYDRGKRGEEMVYGSPIIKVSVPKYANGQRATIEEVLWALLNYYDERSEFTYGGLEDIKEQGGQYEITLYASVSGNPENYAVKAPGGIVTIYHRLEYEPSEISETPRYVYIPYSDTDSEAFGVFRSLSVRTSGNGTDYYTAVLVPDSLMDGNGIVRARIVRENEYFQPGEIPTGADGKKIQKTEWRQDTRTERMMAEEKVWREIPVYMIGEKLYAHADGQYKDQFGNFQSDERERLEHELRLVVPNRFISLSAEDVAGNSDLSGWRTGDVIGGAAYYQIFKRAYVKAYRKVLDESEQAGSYGKRQKLLYPGQDYPWQDGEGKPGTEENTRKNPIRVQERVIRQKIQMIKTIENRNHAEDQTLGEHKLPGFRFKVYLKSNLQSLYRDEAGVVVWLDRQGNVIDILKEKKNYPGLVMRIHTKVLHRTEPIQKNSYDSAVANRRLYDYDQEGKIFQNQNEGYTSVLESEQIDGIWKYRYDKFFAAIRTVNQDKWDDAAPTYTSSRPIGNTANRRDETIENAKTSDMVRQFAIDWYLDDEVAKLTREIESANVQKLEGKEHLAYSDDLLDQAMYRALEKAQNYLKPFFKYDLDEIYAVAWEAETEGGVDHDQTTLVCDQNQGEGELGYYYGVSAYLPYGIYVASEQQPKYDAWSDFANKHYQIDKPKEIVVPEVPETMTSSYCYQADMDTADMESRYHIRFREEDQVIRAHSHFGDFEVYPYGLSTEMVRKGIHFRLTQSFYRPYKNYYNEDDVRSEVENPYYISGNQTGRKEVSGFYRYSSESESAGGENEEKRVMQGSLTAEDGRYAAMLVPYTMTESVQGKKTESVYEGVAHAKMKNQFYSAKLRIEKLDSQTHENILHDDAVFRIYRAKREEKPDGQGAVLFYETDTMISGSREFLESMGAKQIRPIKRVRSLLDFLFKRQAKTKDEYTGVIPKGTPICEENDLVVLDGMSPDGTKMERWRAYGTIFDGMMQVETVKELVRQQQITGYAELPDSLGAGVYVIAEEKAPDGYVRSKPIAVEIYSDKITYYKEGERENRILAAIYDQGQKDAASARIYVENAPICLESEKLKETGTRTVTYLVSGRVDGRLADIGNQPDLVYAYKHGEYQGYAWKKGTLEQLAARREAGEQVELVYENGLFAGYGYVTRILEAEEADEKENLYAVGARMTLYDAIEIKPSGDSQDHGYDGLTVVRNGMGNVTRMYVTAGYGGYQAEYRKKKEEEVPLWETEQVERPDTDILYYDLDGLSVTALEWVDGKEILYGYDRNFRKIPISQIQSDLANHIRTDTDHSIFAFRGGQPYLELVGGDFNEVRYSSVNKILEVGKRTHVYHLDRDGNRDALINPYTGMAYLVKDFDGTNGSWDQIAGTSATGKGRKTVFVWPVKISRDSYGYVTARDKIMTQRPATVGENRSEALEEESGYLTGSWKSVHGEKSHQQTSLKQNLYGQNMNGEVLFDNNNGSFEKTMNPVIDAHGLVEYYQRSTERYQESTQLYDRNGDFVREKSSDHLKQFCRNSYRVYEEKEMEQGKNRYHRQGEGYILENAWFTSEKAPNDPFAYSMTKGQTDRLKRVPVGSYILEELKAPEGLIKGLPVGVTVQEKAQPQKAAMLDRTIKIEISKLDAPQTQVRSVWEMTETDSKGNPKKIARESVITAAYGYENIKNARLVLYRVGKDGVADRTKPVAEWVTGQTPVFQEGLSTGRYILEESRVPEGFVKAEPVEFEIRETAQVQEVMMYDEHTRLQFRKFEKQNGQEVLLNGAEFALYPAGADTPVYSFTTDDGKRFRGFITEFEELYGDYGAQTGTSLAWEYKGQNYQAVCRSTQKIGQDVENTHFPTAAILMYQMNTGEMIRVKVYGDASNWLFEYQFDHQKLPEVNEYASAWLTIDGLRRMEYLPVGQTYRLVEEKPPKGYIKHEDIWITVGDTADIQQYSMENKPGKLWIDKRIKQEGLQQAGAVLTLYRSDENGNCSVRPELLVERWISGKEGRFSELEELNGVIPEGYRQGDFRPHEISGLERGIYWLVEESAPEYYTAAKPLRISYEKNEVFSMVLLENSMVKGRVKIRKMGEAGESLAGAVFRLRAYSLDVVGTLILERVVSIGEEGEAEVGDLPVGRQREDGTLEPYRYELQEIVPPKGHHCSDTVYNWYFSGKNGILSYQENEETVIEITCQNRKTEVQITKTDMTGKKEVPGAVLQVLDEEGTILLEWTSTEEPYVIRGILEEGRSYILREISAPEGYHLAEDIRFTVLPDGQVTAVIMKDEKKEEQTKPTEPETTEPVKPTEPETPAESETSSESETPGESSSEPEHPTGPSKPDHEEETESFLETLPETSTDETWEERPVGRIFAEYRKGWKGGSRFAFGGITGEKIPKLGYGKETSLLKWIWLFGISVLLLFLWLIVKGFQKRDKEKSSPPHHFHIWMLAGLCVVAMFGRIGIIDARASESEILEMVSEAFLAEEAQKHRPESRYYDGSVWYELLESSLIQAEIPQKKQYVRDTAKYTEVEQIEQLPQKLRTEVTDSDTGVSVEAEIPVEKAEFTNWRWMDGFTLPIMVQQYDAGRFYLGDRIVTAGDGEPFADYAEELLKLAGLSPKYYRIDATRWDGEAWLAEDGFWHRKAWAEGRKQVADCFITYGGNVLLPARQGMAWRAVYRREEPEPDGDGTISVQPEEKEQTGPKNFWKLCMENLVRIIIGVLPFALLFLILFLAKKQRDKQKKQKEKDLQN